MNCLVDKKTVYEIFLFIRVKLSKTMKKGIKEWKYIPKQIIHDNDLEFKNKMIESFCEENNIRGYIWHHPAA